MVYHSIHVIRVPEKAAEDYENMAGYRHLQAYKTVLWQMEHNNCVDTMGSIRVPNIIPIKGGKFGTPASLLTGDFIVFVLHTGESLGVRVNKIITPGARSVDYRFVTAYAIPISSDTVDALLFRGEGGAEEVKELGVSSLIEWPDNYEDDDISELYNKFLVVDTLSKHPELGGNVFIPSSIIIFISHYLLSNRNVCIELTYLDENITLSSVSELFYKDEIDNLIERTDEIGTENIEKISILCPNLSLQT